MAIVDVELVEKEQVIETGGEMKSIMDVADLMKDLCTSYNQGVYNQVVNKIISKINKSLVGIEGMTLYKIVMDGYNEIKWDKEMTIKDITMEIELKESDKSKFVKGVRMLLSDLNKRMEKSVPAMKDGPQKIGAINSITHCFINLMKGLGSLGFTVDEVEKLLNPFNNLIIK